MNASFFLETLRPFAWASGLFACALLILWLTSHRMPKTGYATAWVMVGAGFALMLAGFVCRMVIGGRAPVTNMYESILWAAFGIVFFAMLFEATTRSRHLFLSALPVACVALFLADAHPALFDATIHPLPPVLRNNFWLATHVTTITLGYAALALAMGAGHGILWKRLRGRPVAESFMHALLRSLQVGVLLLAAGTVLGGVWAHFAWGRFWGWDPKETWALVTLLCYVALLHGRVAGWWGGFGLAVGSILAFQAVLMAWYGVNYLLGAGLHSYGSGRGGFGYALGFTLVELTFIAVALLRKREGEVAPSAS